MPGSKSRCRTRKGTRHGRRRATFRISLRQGQSVLVTCGRKRRRRHRCC